LAIQALALLYIVYLFSHQPEFQKSGALEELLSWNGEVLIIHARAKESACQVQGSLPDAECTPGAIFQNATTQDICVPGYTKTVRSVSTSLKKKVYQEYGIAYPPEFGTYEADHLIPLALGGSNDIANLFPEAADPAPGFKEKDVVENFLHEEVCAGRVDLSVAQYQIAKNWLLIYNSLDPEVIKDFKNKYKSWAN